MNRPLALLIDKQMASKRWVLNLTYSRCKWIFSIGTVFKSKGKMTWKMRLGHRVKMWPLLTSFTLTWMTGILHFYSFSLFLFCPGSSATSVQADHQRVDRQDQGGVQLPPGAVQQVNTWSPLITNGFRQSTNLKTTEDLDVGSWLSKSTQLASIISMTLPIQPNG